MIDIDATGVGPMTEDTKEQGTHLSTARIEMNTTCIGERIKATNAVKLNSQRRANRTETTGWEGFYNVPAVVAKVRDCEARRLNSEPVREHSTN